MFLLSELPVTYQPLLQPGTRPIPVSFAGHADSVGIGNENWRTFFDDPYLVQLIDTALGSNLDLRIATQRIEGARAAYAYTQGFLAPQVNLVASAGLDRYGAVYPEWGR